jgi:hypothetical protein
MKTDATTSTNVTKASPTMKTNTTHTDWALARRDLLKALGVGAACLPLLSAGRARAATAPKRLITILTSEGYRMQYWKPAQAGSLMSQTMPDTLMPLDRHKADLIVMPNLNNVGFGTGASGGHGSYGSVFYGLEPGKVSYKRPKGSSFDQVIAAGIPKTASGRPCLPLHIQLERSPQSNPGTPASNRCFWIGGQPVNPIGDPYQVYQEIFGGGAPATPGPNTSPADEAAVTRLMVSRKSILDYVGRRLDAFKNRLGAEDKASIDAHHESVRQLEAQLQSAGMGGGNGKCSPHPGAKIDIADGQQYPNILDAHMWLMVDALKCGITRIASMQTSDSSGNNINFAFVPGVPANGTGYKTAYRNYHDLGHNPVLGATDHKRIVDKWFMERFAILLDRLKAVPEDGGTLLSNTAVLFGNHMQDGSNHDANHLPWLLAGSCGGYFKTGICTPEGKPTNGVMTELCNAFGVKSIFGYDLPDIRA